MPARESEALILRSYPYREADLIVSFFARDRGKLRGIARGVRRPKSRFGSALERLAHVQIAYFQKQTTELVRVDAGELLRPPLLMRADYETSLSLDYVAEVADGLLPDHEPQDPYFRLLSLVVDEFWSRSKDRPQPGWQNRILIYFGLWSLRLSGWLPPLNVCLETGIELPLDGPAWFDRSYDGLLSPDARTQDSWPLSGESRMLAAEMLRTSLPELPADGWSADTAQDLRRFLNQRLESHLEKRLKTLKRLEEAIAC